MTMSYIREHYGVPAKRGARIRWHHHLQNVPSSPADGTIVTQDENMPLRNAQARIENWN